MTAAEVLAAMKSLRVDMDELAHEFGVSERTVRRWTTDGCDGTNEVALRACVWLDRQHLAWKKGAVNIRLASDGIHMSEGPLS